MRLYIIFIHLVFTLFSLNVFGESNTETNALEYIYTNFTTRDGLPSNETYCVFQDSKGYIWIGTDRGLVRYDGYDFKVFTTEDGLTSNVIFGIAEDSKGNIWMTTSNLGLCYITPNNQIKLYKLKDTMYADHSNTFFFDNIKIQDDILLLTQFRFGYIQIDLNTFDVISNKNYYLKEGQNIYIQIVKNKSQHNIFRSGLRKIMKEYSIVYNQENNQSGKIKIGRVTDICYVLQDSLYYLNKGIYNINKTRVTKVLSLDYGMHVFEFDSNLFINKLDKGNQVGSVYLVNDVLDSNSWAKILNEKIRLTSAIRDKNGGFWLTSVSKGVFYIPNRHNKVVKRNFNTKVILPYNNGITLLGRNNKGFIYKEGKINVFNSSIKIDRLFPNYEKSITFSHPIKMPEIEKWIYKHSAMSGNELYGCLFVGDKRYLVCISKLFMINDKGDIKELFHDTKLPKIYALTKSEGEKLILADVNGLYGYENDSILPYITDGYQFNYPPRDVKYIKSKKILAVSTIGNGLYLFKNGQFLNKLTVKNGLVSNSINQLMLDDRERLWLGTNKGVNYIEIDDRDSVSIGNLFATSRGLLSPNVQQLYMIDDSIMLVGTDHGVNEINVLGLERNKKSQVPLFITGFHINDSLEYKKELEYDENNITIYYTALEFNRYGNINYRYRLNGLSDTWIQTKERKAIFTAVNPGTYTFELEVQNEYGDWIGLENPPEFTIHKPYWRTWWFIGGGVLLGVLIIGGALYYYISNLKKEKAFLENEQQLSSELNESQQKALSSQLNPHFVFNSLNSIQNFILTKRTELSSDYLSMFSKLMRYIFENSKKLYVSLTDEIEALRLYLELEQVRHNHKFRYEIDSGDLDTSQFSLPALLIQPMIENAIWHGLLHKLEDDRLLQIKFKSNESHLLIEVIDNGVGRGGSQPRKKFIKKQRSSGVELTKQRLHLLSQSTGLSTSFEIVDLVDDKGNPKGTRVEISIPAHLNDQD